MIDLGFSRKRHTRKVGVPTHSALFHIGSRPLSHQHPVCDATLSAGPVSGGARIHLKAGIFNLH